MPKDDLELVLGRLPSHRLMAQVPARLRPWLLPFDWDRDQLWRLDLQRSQRPLDDFRWHLDRPWWRHGRSWFQITPRQFQANPALYPEHAQRIAHADLSYPLHIVRRRQRWLILDGIHRLLQHEVLGHEVLDVLILTPDDVVSIARDPSRPHT